MDFEAALRAFGSPAGYLAFTAGLILLVVAFEYRRPALRAATGWRRWSTHGGLGLINGLLGSELGQGVIVLVVALHLPVNHFLMNHYHDAPVTVIAVSVLALDLAAYLFHRFMHLDGLWRVHRLHHSDRSFDAATSLRFHPIESALTVVWRLVWVIALGVPYLALLAHGLLSALFNTFTHANLRLPPRLSTALGAVFITPDLHRIHHSLDDSDSRHNFGTIFSFWDRLFGTYRLQTRQNARVPATGVAGISAEQTRGLWQSLWLPFARDAAPQTSIVRPEPVEGRTTHSWFDKLTTNGDSSKSLSFSTRLKPRTTP